MSLAHFLDDCTACYLQELLQKLKDSCEFQSGSNALSVIGDGRYVLIENDYLEDNKDLVPYSSFERAMEFVLQQRGMKDRKPASVEVEVLASGHHAYELYAELDGEGACTAA